MNNGDVCTIVYCSLLREKKNKLYETCKYGGIFKSQGLYRNAYLDNTRTNKGVDKADKDNEQDRQTCRCLKQLGIK